MKLKKFLALATVTAVCGCSAAFAACQTAEHEHSWGEWQVTTPATCSQGGVETRVCADDPEHKETRATDPLGHDWGEWTLTTPASCESAAEQTRTCKHDSAHKETRAFGEARGHSWDEGTVTTPATCTSAGEKTFTCTADGCEKTKTEPVAVDSSAHKWGEWTEKTPATCTESKVEERTCAHDSAHKETRKSGAPLGHKWDEGTVTTLPQVGVAGEKTFTCTVTGCGATKTEPVPALDHTHSYTGEWQKDASGHWKVCDGSDCNEKSMQAEHDWDEGAVTTPATCSAAGVKTFTCETCGFTKTEPVPVDATAHKWGEWADKTAATCTAAKTQERVCEHNPEHKDTQTVGEPLGHVFGAWTLKTAPTANDAGTAEKTCTHDGCSEKHSAQMPPLGDAAYTKGEDTATCTEAGEMQYTLTLEEEQFSFTVATQAKGHNLLAMPAQQATCMDKGNQAYWVCGHCRQLFSDAEGKNDIDAPVETPIEKHALVHKDGKEASCTEDGFEEYYECDWCHVKFEDYNGETVLASPAVIPAHHTVKEAAPTAEATDGTILKDECEVCGEVLNEYYFVNTTRGSTVPTKNLYLKIARPGNFELTLESDYVYTFEMQPFTTAKQAFISGVYLNDRNNKVAYSARSAAAVNSSYTNIAEHIVQDDNTIKFVFNAKNHKGEKLIVEYQSIIDFKLYITAEDKSLKYGENIITITEANASYDSSERYTFTSEETKTYSVTVPAGMTVCIGDDEFTADEGNASVNFEGTADTPITMVFINGKTGEFTVTIGEAVKEKIEVNKAFSLDIPSGGAKEMTSVELGNSVAEGKYKITITLVKGNLRNCYLFMAVNGDPTYDEMGFNGSTFNGVGVGLMFSQFHTNNPDVYSGNCMAMGKYEVTTTLKAGDVLHFAQSGTINGGISITITPVI